MSKSFKVPQSVRNNAARGLELRREHKRGGLDSKQAKAEGVGSGVQRASDLKSGSVSYETVKRMKSFFARHSAYKKHHSDKSSKAYISWMLWGWEMREGAGPSLSSREKRRRGRRPRSLSRRSSMNTKGLKMSDWQDYLGKALVSFGNSLSKGETIDEPKDDPKGMLFDPFSYWGSSSYGGDYRQRPSQMSFDMLRQMSTIPLVSAILQVRCTQVASFARPSQQENYAGFRIQMRDSNKSPTRATLKRIKELNDFVINTGHYEDKRVNYLRDDFGIFLKKVVRDSLIYDQMVFQIVPNAKGDPAAFQAMSAHSIRLAKSASDGGFEYNPEVPFAVQVFEEQTIAEFRPDELCFGIRNPRSDLEVGGYGFSELEMLIHTLTGYLYAIQYNQKFLVRGWASKGCSTSKAQSQSDSSAHSRESLLRWSLA